MEAPSSAFRLVSSVSANHSLSHDVLLGSTVIQRIAAGFAMTRVPQDVILSSGGSRFRSTGQWTAGFGTWHLCVSLITGHTKLYRGN